MLRLRNFVDSLINLYFKVYQATGQKKKIKLHEIKTVVYSAKKPNQKKKKHIKDTNMTNNNNMRNYILTIANVTIILSVVIKSVVIIHIVDL